MTHLMEAIPVSAHPKLVTERITETINRWTSYRIRNLLVEIDSGTIVLSGQASSFHIKQLAQRGVREVMPQIPLRNCIAVSKDDTVS